MAFFNFLGQIMTFAVVKLFEQVLNAADWIMFTIEDYEVYENIVKFLSFCVGNFYFWQMVAAIGFCHSLRRLAAKFPSPIIPVDMGPMDCGPNLVQLLAEKENSLKDASGKNEDLDKEVNVLRAKVAFLEKEVDFISKDRYALVRDKCILQNKLGDFNSWPEFRIEFDELATKYEAMKRQRAREHISYEQILHVAKEAKLELAAAKRAETMGKLAHSEELKAVKQERDDSLKKYQTLLDTTTAAAAITAATPTAATITTVATAAEVNTPREIALREIALQEENTRLTLALHSQTSLLAKRMSDLERMQSLVKTRSEHSASQLNSATSTILALKEDKKKADKHIAELKEETREANERAVQMEGLSMARASPDDEEEGQDEVEKEEEEEEDEGGEEERPPTQWLLEQVVAMSKQGRTEDGSGSHENHDDEDGEDGGEENNEGEEDEEDEEEKKIHDENEDLFQDMMGCP